MGRFPFQSSISLLTTALLLAAPAAFAQNELDTPSKPAAKEPAARPRAISGDLAAALSASMPKYNPPKPVEKKPEDLVDLREVDKPRNQIIRLPEYVVKEKKPPVFNEREISTSKGLAAIALRRYFSETGLALNRFTLPLIGMSKEAYALMLYAEDERLRNISDLKSSADDISLVNPENAKAIRQATQDTYHRGFDYTYRKRD